MKGSEGGEGERRGVKGVKGAKGNKVLGSKYWREKDKIKPTTKVTLAWSQSPVLLSTTHSPVWSLMDPPGVYDQ